MCCTVCSSLVDSERKDPKKGPSRGTTGKDGNGKGQWRRAGQTTA